MTTTIDHPTGLELVTRAVNLQPLLRKRLADSEIERRQSDEVIEALTAAGFFRLNKPTRYGGYQIELRTVVEITEKLAEADGSAAWLVGIASAGAWAVNRGTQRLCEEIFADPDATIAGSGMVCPARREQGGLRLAGRWGYASGSPHARWAALGAAVADGDPDEPPAAYFCLVPTAQLQLEDTWHTVGMRGTGSNTYVATDLFVPDYRLVAVSDLAEATAGDAPTDRLPFAPVAVLVLMGTLLGLGHAALKLVVDQAALKSMHQTSFARQSDSVGVQVQVAQAALMLQTAQLHTYRVADELDRVTRGGSELTYRDRAQGRAQFGYAAQQVLEAIQILLNVHGAAAFAGDSLMHQYWRDANTAARHAALNVFVGYEVFGKALLEVPERISPMV
jgi:alkylation response protein AidB-like acyl-CoA dehydrogenase